MTDTIPIETGLARLADGSLPERGVAELRARVRESPELQAHLRAQQRAVGLIEATGEVAAPAAVHAAVRRRLAARTSQARVGARRSARRLLAFAPLGGAIAAVVVAVAALSGGPRSPTVAGTARLALATSSRAAPRVDRTDSDLLSLRVDSIAFPAYESRSDWRATGARTDEVDARRVPTVFYDIAGRRVGYSIVPGHALRVPRGPRHVIRGVTYVTGEIWSAGLVTWRRDGHTCVIAGRGVSTRTLLRLADATQVTS